MNGSFRRMFIGLAGVLLAAAILWLFSTQTTHGSRLSSLEAYRDADHEWRQDIKERLQRIERKLDGTGR